MKPIFLLIFLSFLFAQPAHGQVKSYKQIHREQKAAAKTYERLVSAAEGGDMSACITIADSFLRLGYGAKPWYRMCWAQGNAHCAYGLATTFLAVAPNQAQMDSGIYFLNLAVKAGSTEAMCLLGSFYHGGRKPDLFRKAEYRCTFPKDTMMSRVLYQQAAMLKYKPAQEKLDLYAIAAGNPTFAGYNAYQNGNYRLAYRLWIIGAIEEQDPVAMYSLGIMALNNNMPTDIIDFRSRYTWRDNDIRTAREWFECAGSWGYASGSYMAGEMWYREGARDYAIRNWTQAAEQGYPGASERIRQTQSELAREQSARDEWVKQYNASFNERARNNFYSAPEKRTQTTTPSTTTNSAKSDQEMYDKMHHEADQREKWYNNKWGR